MANKWSQIKKGNSPDYVPVRGVKCPMCGKEQVVAVMPFDYAKMCMNDKCPYLKTKEARKNGWRYTFSNGEHN